jgi:hypothetical protein
MVAGWISGLSLPSTACWLPSVDGTVGVQVTWCGGGGSQRGRGALLMRRWPRARCMRRPCLAFAVRPSQTSVRRTRDVRRWNFDIGNLGLRRLRSSTQLLTLGWVPPPTLAMSLAAVLPRPDPARG